MHIEHIEKLIQDKIADATVEVTTDDSMHFSAVVISNSFAGKDPLTRQRMVYKGIAAQIADGTIHALSLKTYTQQEWDAR